jgi:hypothetical protein
MDEHVTIAPAEKKLILFEAREKEIFRILYIVLILAFAFLFLRIVLRAFGANPQSVFAGIVYIISTLFLLPFLNMFPQFHDTPIIGQPAFDAAAMFAIFCYAVAILVIMGITHIVIRILKTEKQVNEVVKKDHPVDTKIVSEVIK